MPSDLYKMGRLMNLEPFTVRVRAAMLQHAAAMTLTAPYDLAENFAIWVLKNPTAGEDSMLALVAADPEVLSTVSMDNDVLANVENLSDADIKRVVAARWNLVAAKYASAAS